jgi:hypothetical protein
MARKQRVSSAGVPEHLIQRGYSRQARSACEEDMQAYVGWLKTSSQKYKVRDLQVIAAEITSIDFVDISFGGSDPAFPACNVSAQKGLILGQMTWTSFEWSLKGYIRNDNAVGAQD